MHGRLNRLLVGDVASDADRLEPLQRKILYDSIFFYFAGAVVSHHGLKIRHNQATSGLPKTLQNAVTEATFEASARAERHLAIHTFHSIDSVTMNVAPSANSRNCAATSCAAGAPTAAMNSSMLSTWMSST